MTNDATAPQVAARRPRDVEQATHTPAAEQPILVGVMVIIVAVYAVGLILMSDLIDRAPGLAIAAWWLPALVCWVSVRRVGGRPSVVLAALAMSSYAAAATYVLLVPNAVAGPGLVDAPPSLIDVAYLLFYPLLVVAILLSVRRHSRGLAASVWWDSMMGALGTAAVMAVVIDPIIGGVATGAFTGDTAVRLAYPVFDLMLVACVAGIAGLVRLSGDDRWALLMAGLAVFAAADVLANLRLSDDGNVPAVGWAIGLALMSIWVSAADPHVAVSTPSPADVQRSGSAALLVSLAAGLVGLGLLVAGTRVPMSIVAVTLAAATVAAAVIRSHRAFRLLRHLVDLRRVEATTDELTGLPNRRVLYAERPPRSWTSRRGAGRCSSSTSTGSRRSTTAWATTSATGC